MKTWVPVSGFNDHPEQPTWVGSDKDETPDGGKLHSILVDPRDPGHLYLSMSGGGIFECAPRVFGPALRGEHDAKMHDRACVHIIELERA